MTETVQNSIWTSCSSLCSSIVWFLVGAFLSSVFFLRPPEVTKIVLSKVYKILRRRQCWPKELNQKGFPRNIQYRSRPKGPPCKFFRHCTFFKKIPTKGSPFNFFGSFATEWMLKNPKGSSLSVLSAVWNIFSIFFHKRFQIHQYFDILKSFCYFWALDRAPTWAGLGLLYHCRELPFVNWARVWQSSTFWFTRLKFFYWKLINLLIHRSRL